MSKGKKKLNIKNQQERKSISGKKISNTAFEAPDDGSTDHLYPVFSFADACPNHFQLCDWHYEDLKHLMDKFRDYSKKTWAELYRQKGFISVDPSTFSQELPHYISPDVTIYECRISKRARLFGHRHRSVFNVIWFDRNHEVYPMS
jgi:hypothetical protein